MEFAAASVRQREASVTDAGDVSRQICEVASDKMNQFALALDANVHGYHAGGED
jgi:hypothetical protein